MRHFSSKFKIIFTYALFGFLWIFYSDKVVSSFIKDIESISSIQSYKGFFFILFTSLLLYYLIRLYEKEQDEIKEQLLKTKEHYIALLEQAPYSIEVYNKEGLLTYANEEHTKFWGFEKFVMVNKLNILTDKKFAKSGLLKYVNKAYEGHTVEIPAYHFNPAISTSVTNNVGVEKLIKTHIYPIKNTVGDVVDIVVTHLDVSAQENEKKLDNLLSLVFESIPDILFLIKKDGTLIDYRAKSNENLYIEPEFFIGKNIINVLPNDTSKLFEKYLKKAVDEKVLQIFDYKLLINKVNKNFEARMSILPDDEHLMIIVRDITENIRRKEQLKFQSLLLEQSLAATSVVDEEGKITYVNDAYVKMWGYDNVDEILGKSPVSHCEDPNMPKTIIEKIEKDSEHIFELKARKKDGKIFDVLMGAKFIHFNNKNFYLGSSIDISEKLELSKRYETIFNNAREGVFLHELDGRLIDVNPYIERLHNISKDKLIGVNISSFFKEKDLDKYKLFLNELIINGEVKFEMELQNLDASLFYASIKSQVIELEGRKVVYGTIKDLTILNENVLLLERANKIFENIEEGVMITDSNGYITEINRAFRKITGYSYNEAIGKNASILKSGNHNIKFYEELWNRLEKRNKWSGKIINKKKNGETYTSFLTISAIRDKDNKIQNFVGIFTDISDILKNEKELREKDILLIQNSKMAAMGEMIDNIAHQWKQPLNIISMSSGLLKLNQGDDKFSSEEEIESALTNIDKAVKHLTSTIDDFRNFFNPDKTKKEFLLSNCVNRVSILLKYKLQNKEIQIIKEFEDLQIFGVENELVQVLMNLISNSIDAFEEIKEEEKYIFIDSYKEDNHIIIAIKDNAGGILEDIIEKVFESRFTTKEEGKGTGIGLYMCKNIIESYKGTLCVENSKYKYNEKDFKGATFTIKIPC